MRKFLFLNVISVFFILILSSSAFSENISITTYYPSPYGSYQELRVNQMSVGSGYAATALANGNLLIQGQVGIGTITPGVYKVQVIGNVDIQGNVSKLGGTFLIDHPLDPKNKILRHSFIESPDMKNIYDGIAILDDKGEAVVNLPDYFEALNSDFRYQLTSIGRYASIYIKQEIKDNKFVIAGGYPNLKVSWMITGIRKDVYALENKIVVEEEKGVNNSYKKGEYIYPKGFLKNQTKDKKGR